MGILNRSGALFSLEPGSRALNGKTTSCQVLMNKDASAPGMQTSKVDIGQKALQKKLGTFVAQSTKPPTIFDGKYE